MTHSDYWSLAKVIYWLAYPDVEISTTRDIYRPSCWCNEEDCKARVMEFRKIHKLNRLHVYENASLKKFGRDAKDDLHEYVDALWKQLRDGNISATGVRIETRDVVEIQRIEWPHLHFSMDLSCNLMLGTNASSFINKYSSIKLLSSEVISLWQSDNQLKAISAAKMPKVKVENTDKQSYEIAESFMSELIANYRVTGVRPKTREFTAKLSKQGISTHISRTVWKDFALVEFRKRGRH